MIKDSVVGFLACHFTLSPSLVPIPPLRVAIALTTQSTHYSSAEGVAVMIDVAAAVVASLGA
jgi:hypothetical protein